MTTTMLTPVPHAMVRGTVAVRADVFPANVEFSFLDDQVSKSRTIVTADEVIVLAEGVRGGNPNVVYSGRLEDVTGDRKALVATTADGVVTITRGSGCGCGSRLKSYRPFQRAVRMPSR